ncbi:hypothetical protein G6F50_014348 [Rhizopus delemar]|uniref:Uncharacterized protein n=1 Tax=Rhizopus delemar TaxID=936053 RepID=A0A9P7C8P2_9FUNG|nr:hypothetical protein G6F50_014348 [Rhizopus delemar]
MRSTAPCLSRFTLPRMKASGLARSRAIIARSRLTWLPRATALAICDKVWPRCTVTLPSAGMAATGGGTARDRAGAGAGVGAGADGGVPGASATGAAAGSRAMVLDRVPAGATISGSATATGPGPSRPRSGSSATASRPAPARSPAPPPCPARCGSVRTAVR